MISKEEFKNKINQTARIVKCTNKETKEQFEVLRIYNCLKDTGETIITSSPIKTRFHSVTGEKYLSISPLAEFVPKQNDSK